MLRNRRDFQSVAYLLALPLLVVVQWRADAFSIALYLPTLVLAVGVSCINHNHAHLSIWKNRYLNRLTDHWIGTLQGHPVFMFEAAHIDSHHRHNQLDGDVTRIEQFGRDNHIVGYLLFPLRVLRPLRALKREYLRRVRIENPRLFLHIVVQHVPLFAIWAVAFALDWKKAVVYLLVPQAVALHFLLASNYLQHARTTIGSSHDHSRNFVGWMNLVLFNVGYHTAHHELESLHWSRLPRAHAEIARLVSPRLIERSLVGYFVGVLAFGFFRRDA